LHPQFAVPVGLLVWKKYLEPIIRAVYVLIDRIRKAPRDKMLFKSLESLGTSSAAPLCSSAGMARFLIATSQFIKQLLAANCQIAADDQLEWLELFGRSIKGLIDVKPVNKEWFDYFGRDIFHFCSSMRRLNWYTTTLSNNYLLITIT
jgi:hypothetical protein